MQYDWILFDADETLFHFDGYSGIKLMLERKGMTLTDEAYHAYQQVNKPLWVEYQNGSIDAEQIKQRRFSAWADELNTTAQEMNFAYMMAMADICTLLPGAQQLIEALSGKAKLGIITNGFADLQAIRLERTGMANHFQHVVISEQVGAAKPDAAIFEYTYNLIGKPDKQRVLMVGDNPHSDILGGLNFGFDTCWLNVNGETAPDNIHATIEVNSLEQLQQYLLV